MGLGFGSLETARTGMFVNERGLYVTGHNISNINTPGYTRQQAMIENGPVLKEWNGFEIGLGADIQQIRQIRNSFLDNIYRQENSTLGYWQARSKTLQDIEAILGEPMGSGLQSVLNQFWDSWQELSKDPDSLTVRAVVRQRAENLVEQINHLGSQLDKLQNDLDSEIKVRIDEINKITSQIANLNVEIAKAEAAGDTANDYRDQRNLLIDKLTELTGADVYEMQDGQVSVAINGYFLVQKNTSNKIYAGRKNEDDVFVVPMLEGSNIEIQLTTGSLKGLMEARGQESYLPQIQEPGEMQFTESILAQLKKGLNLLVSTLFKSVNDLHKSGKIMNNQTAIDGDDFFALIDASKPPAMGNIKLNDNLRDLNNIVASESGDMGDNTIALKISALRHEPMIQDASGILSMDDYYQALILRVGNAGSDAARIAENQQKVVQSSDDYRQSIMGVSMDEEMTNLLKYRFAYNASARTINVIDEMLETIIVKTGIVGR